jgi:hypothetical protein
MIIDYCFVINYITPEMFNTNNSLNLSSLGDYKSRNHTDKTHLFLQSRQVGAQGLRPVKSH